MQACKESPMLFATANKGKLKEVVGCSRLLGIEIVGLDHLSQEKGEAPDVLEIGGSYFENAECKAREYALWAGRSCMADDTGLEFPFLFGMPGIYTGRWGLRRVCEELVGYSIVPAHFVCCIAYAEPGGRTVSALGTLEGDFNLAAARVVGDKSSLPFAPFFKPHGYDKVLCELTDSGTFLSHRGKALQSVLRALS
jgi:XTP/dITP diphosphohydrolase